MTLEIEVSESDIVNQSDYADWYIRNSGTNLRRNGEASDGRCQLVDENGKTYEFDLIALTVEVGEDEIDLKEMADANGAWAGPCEDFDCLSMKWAIDNSSGEPVNVLVAID